MYPLLLLLLLPPLQDAAPQAVLDAVAGATRPVAERPPVAPPPAPAPAVVALQSDLEGLLRRVDAASARWGVLVVSLDRGDTLFSHTPDRPLMPASNMKLFTSAAALYYLGPDFRYGTYLVTDGRIEQGAVTGDLIVYGTGDPTLSDRFYPRKTTVWEEFADSLAALGVTEVWGDIVGDASYFSGPATGIGWQESYMNTWYAAPASALSFNNNMVTLYIRPGEEVGWRPRIQLIPGGRGIAIVNQATTVPNGRTWIDVNRAAYDGPIVVRGRIGAGHSGVWRSVPVGDPARYAVTVLREVLEQRGIRVMGGTRSVQVPEASVITGRSIFAPVFDNGRAPIRTLAVHRSPPVREILEVVNKDSHNFYAEQVLRTIGRVASGDGSVQGGGRAVHEFLERETGSRSRTLRIADGSGLSVLNQVDAQAVIELLAYMADSPLWEAFWSTLPEAGNARGLQRMYRTAAAGNLRAKTGTIDRVSALSGYVRAANSERLAFSILSNNVPSTWRAKRVEDAIGARLASFDRPPAPAWTASATPPVTVTAAVDTAGPAAASMAVDTAGPRYHVIRSGDTLEGIAKRYDTTVRALEEANPGIEPRRLLPGRTLEVP